jgi:molecular chaperone DnaK
MIHKYLIDRAIVTIPAYFDIPKIEATRKAAELAGIKTLQLLHEPTAAAIYYCWKHKITKGNFLVYDLGGGTFDVSVIRRDGGSFEVLGIAGDNVLGGDTFDMALADYIISELNKGKYNLNLDVQKDPKDRLIFDHFTYKAEGIKQSLTTQDVILFSDTSCPETDKDGNSIYVELKITRKIFEKIIHKHVVKTIEKCYEAIDKAKEKASGTFNGIQDITHILLVGGSTWTPYVKQVVKDNLCAKEGESLRSQATDVLQDEPDECVAMGASLLASSAGGIDFIDDSNNILLHLDGSSISSDEELKIKGKVTHADGKNIEGINGYTVSLEKDGEEVADAELGEMGNFYFDEVYLDTDIASNLVFILRNYDGKEIGRYGRTIEQGEESVPEFDSVNSHPIWIDTRNSKGEIVKKILIESGDTLPAQKEFEFSTSHELLVVFKLYQGNKVIKEFTHNFEEIQAVGTKVHLTMNVDDQGIIIMRSIIAGLEPFIMETKALPPEPPITIDDLKAKRKEFDDIKDELDKGHKITKELQVKTLSKEIEECIQRGDDPRASELMDELNRIVEDAKPTIKKLRPSKDEFISKIKDLRRKVFDNKDAFEKYDELIKNLDAQEKTGFVAYENNDQYVLNECMTALNKS